MNKIVLFFIFLLVSFELRAAEQAYPAIVEENVYSDIAVTKLRLSNEMTILLKPTQFENNEIFIKLEALGGYAALPPADRFSAEFASQIAWESGFGGKSADQISLYLYENSVGLEPKIQAFSRTIEGNSNKNGLDAFLNTVRMIFTEQQFTQEGLEAAYSKAKDSLEMLEWDYGWAYEAALLRVNTNGMSLMQPMSVEDLTKVNFNVAKNVFQKAFGDPGDFVCVIVGTFEIGQAKELISRYLGAIPKSKLGSFPKNYNPSLAFPQGITTNEIQLEASPEESLTRLTFPLQISMNKNSMLQVAFVSQVIEQRLRQTIRERMSYAYGIDVSYEFPFYPLLNNPWISIRFRCDAKFVEAIRKIVLQELKELQDSGATEEDIKEIKMLEAGSNSFWLRDNFYWMSLLTDYYLWQWDLEWISEGPKMVQELSLKTVNELLKSSFSLKNYSVVTSKP